MGGTCRRAIGDGLWACDPVSGEPKQAGRTVYADDVHETNVADTVEELNGVLHVSNRFLAKELTSRGLGRNEDEEEHRKACEADMVVREHEVLLGDEREKDLLHDRHASRLGQTEKKKPVQRNTTGAVRTACKTRLG